MSAAHGGPQPPADWAGLPFFARDWPALAGRLAAAPGWQPADPFRALRLTPRARVRVVILGQDPYPTPGRATGLAFGFPPGSPPQDSLRNILAELAADLGQPRRDGDLTAWAEQGVLLLNTVLTVPAGQPFGHKGWGWERLTAEVLAAVTADGPRALVLWGRPAQRLGAGALAAGALEGGVRAGAAQEGAAAGARHLVIDSAHPSPLSAYRGFFGSRPFSRVNAWLTAQGQPPVDWLR